MPVALVQVMFVALKALPAGMLKRPVTARLVVVALVEVVLAKLPFQRRAGEPRERRASTVGFRFVVTPFETAKLVVVVWVPVALVQMKFADVREVPFAVVKPKTEAKRLVDVVFVPVALVQMMLVKEDGVAPVTVRLVIFAVVANRLVLVVFVLVTFPNTPLYRREFDPSETARSVAGVINPPEASEDKVAIILVDDAVAENGGAASSNEGAVRVDGGG